MAVLSRAQLKARFMDTDPNDFIGDLVDSFGIGILRTTGTVFYVDPVNGAVGNDGQSPDEPFATLQAGINACTAGKGDIVIRMPGTENPTGPILFNKRGIIVAASAFGVGDWGGSEAGFATYPAASYATGPVAIVSQPCAIYGLEFVTRCVAGGGANDDGTDSDAAMVFIGEGGGFLGGFSLVECCRFVDWWGNDWGIEFAAGAHNTVRRCQFEGFDAGILFRGTASNNPESNRVEDCWFKDCTNGIEHKAGTTPHNFVYKGNVFSDYTDAIDFNNQAADGLVCDNWYETATDAATYDITVAAAGVHGVCFSGNHYAE